MSHIDFFGGLGVGGGCTKSFTFTQYSVSKIFASLYMAPIRDSKFCMRPAGRTAGRTDRRTDGRSDGRANGQVGEINAPTGPN